MSGVSIRDLRNRSAEVLQRVQRGESLTVTRDGEAVATVNPLPRRTARVEELIERRKNLPRLDAADLRRDIDELIDPTL